MKCRYCEHELNYLEHNADIIINEHELGHEKEREAFGKYLYLLESEAEFKNSVGENITSYQDLWTKTREKFPIPKSHERESALCSKPTVKRNLARSKPAEYPQTESMEAIKPFPARRVARDKKVLK